jgi:beta-glucosidase
VPDIKAAQNSLDVAIGWFADPVYLGKYPEYMREMLGDRLPDFTEEEWSVVTDSSDFYGQNTYVGISLRERECSLMNILDYQSLQ